MQSSSIHSHDVDRGAAMEGEHGSYLIGDEQMKNGCVNGDQGNDGQSNRSCSCCDGENGLLNFSDSNGSFRMKSSSIGGTSD